MTHRRQEVQRGGRAGRILRVLGPAIAVIVFCLALWVLVRELRTYRPQQILHHLATLPPLRVLLSLLCAAAGYAVATGYDTLGVRYIGHPLPYRHTALASFVATAFANNMGLGILTGGTVRLRLYSAWGLSLVEISRLVAFYTLTLWLGFFWMGGLAFTVDPIPLPDILRLPFPTARPFGILFLAVVGGYCAATLIVRHPVRVLGHEFPLPHARFLPLQIGIATLDWSFAGAALYLLLPSAQMAFPRFLGLYLLALLSGIISQVPGGLGVFETVFVLLMSGRLPATTVLGSLLAFRGIFYLLPLTVALLLLGAQELARRTFFRRAAQALGRWSSVVAPPLLAATAALGALVLLLSGVIPSQRHRLQWLARVLPLAVIEASHFLASVVGVGLLVLARGLERRLDAAYYLSLALLAAGGTLTLLKGLHYEEALVLGLLFLLLLPGRRYFYRRSLLLSPSFHPRWIAAMALTLTGAAGVAWFLHGRPAYRHDLWWTFALEAGAPRALRALAGAAVAALGAGLVILLRARRASARPLAGEELQRILPRLGVSQSRLVLLDGGSLLAAPGGSPFLVYARCGGSLVAAGEPAGPPREWRSIIGDFRDLAEREGQRAVFCGLSEGSLAVYREMGFAALCVGEQARVELQPSSAEPPGHGSAGRAVAPGEDLEVISPGTCVQVLAELRAVAAAWHAEASRQNRAATPVHVSAGYLSHLPVAVVRQSGRITAYACLAVDEQRREAALVVVRYLPQAPRDIVEYLVAKLLLWAGEAGYRRFDLGMAPPVTPGEWHAASWAGALSRTIYRLGEHFTLLSDLRPFLEQFAPEWSGRYLACPAGSGLAGVASDLAKLVSGDGALRWQRGRARG